jgi:hypothetical protein
MDWLIVLRIRVIMLFFANNSFLTKLIFVISVYWFKKNLT